LTGDAWEVTAPEDLGYCQERIDSLYSFLEEKNSKSFILIKDGRIVLEQYFGSYTQDSLWYWASAAKSLTSYLVGCAQEDVLLSIEDPTSDYLGTGWTSATPEQESAIKIRHQLSMSTGLSDNFLFPDCLLPSCLDYQEDPDERWSYYNAPYRLTLDVLAAASGQNINLYTWNRLGSRIGMGGFWLDYVRWGKARDMARFGLLALNEGVWDNDTILGDQTYLFDMVHPSQDINPAYGYLWWLNGYDSFMLPGTQIVWPGELFPNAADDMFSALGKNDQKIYVVPSQGLVVVRQGNSANQSLAGPSSFDNDLWGMINELVCTPNALPDLEAKELIVYPNPAKETLNIADYVEGEFEILDSFGRVLKRGSSASENGTIDIEGLSQGWYLLKLRSGNELFQTPFLKE
jgi:CubicO group peptidase (beta-lactamase class C family)